jgi:hypothetical protein
MKSTNQMILIFLVALLQACATPAPSQSNSPLGRNTKSAGWVAVSEDLLDSSDGSNLYWARLKKSDASYTVIELSPLPLQRAERAEEILVIDAKRKVARPAFFKRSGQNHVVLAAPCSESEMNESAPYTVCNSAFSGTPTGHILGRAIAGALTLGATELTRKSGTQDLVYFRESLTSVIDGETINVLLPPLAEQRRLATLEKKRKLAEKSDAEARERQESRLIYAERKKVDEAISIKALSQLPRGYKDVCDFTEVVIATRRTPTESDELNCINFGKVASLTSLRQAGFNVTNLIERNPGDPRTSRYNIEKIR